MIAMAVQAFECVGARFTFLCFQSQGVDLVVCSVAPFEISVVLQLVRAVTLDAFGALYSAQESGVAPLPAVLALGDSWVHVCSLDGSGILSYVEAPVDEHLGVCPTLDIPNIGPYNGHVGFGRNFDDLGFGG